MNATALQIVRCLKSDMDGDLAAGADYAERIAAGTSINPWADPSMADAYREAARVLRTELNHETPTPTV